MSSTVADFEAIGTRWQIEVFDSVLPERWKFIEQKVKKRIEQFDQTYSRFRRDSWIWRLSEQVGEYTLPADAEPLFSLYKRLYHITRGAFTPLIGQLLVDAGYDANYSLQPGTPLMPPTWDEVLGYQPPLLKMKRPALLDIGAAGKGYIVDIVGGVLESEGISSYCIDAGGDILSHGNDRPLRIGLEDPNNLDQVIGVVHLVNQSICGSAGNRRTWGAYHHIIDPRTLQSPRHIAATWVVADTALVADALATCLFFTEVEELLLYHKFEYLILYPDYSIKKSNDFPAEIFSA